MAVGRPPVTVEVFPVALDRWIAAVHHPDGPFSTEVKTLQEVPDEVESVLRHVLGRGEQQYRLVDDAGEAWDLAAAARQAAAVGG